MRPDRKQVSTLYKGTVSYFEELTSSKWSWNSGEKPRILQGYIIFCEAAGVRDKDRIPEMMDLFLKIMEKRSKKWIQWSEASRVNYLGFLLRREDLKVEGSKMNTDNKADAKDLEIAGTKTSDEWEF